MSNTKKTLNEETDTSHQKGSRIYLICHGNKIIAAAETPESANKVAIENNANVILQCFVETMFYREEIKEWSIKTSNILQ